MKKSLPPKDVSKAIKQGYQPMFMTGPEIRNNFGMLHGDYSYNTDEKGNTHPETVKQAWDRKLTEAKQPGEKGLYRGEVYGEDKLKVSRFGQSIGVTPESTLEQRMKDQGGRHGVIMLQDPSEGRQIFGGHHRVALAAEQFKNVLQPVEFHPTLHDAKWQEHYE
jgi:hypothetical protein